MKRTMLSNAWVCCGLAIALSGAACSDRGSHETAGSAPGQQTSAAARDKVAANNDQAPVTLTGCLQKGDGRSFILTEINRPRASVGTSGSDSTGAAVEREQLRAAAHAYRLNSDDDKNLESLVGHQVRVSGTVAERADLPAKAGTDTARSDRAANDRTTDKRASGDRNAAASGSNDRAKIDEGDLASIKVATIDSVADACGGKR